MGGTPYLGLCAQALLGGPRQQQQEHQRLSQARGQQ